MIGVGASTQSDGRATFSNWGTCDDIAAPGVDILSAIPGGDYAVWSGTSMAAPMVAGVAALLLSAGVAPADVLTVMHRSGDDAPDTIGGRRVNAWRAVLDAGADPVATITPRNAVTPFPTTDPYPGGTHTPRPVPASATPRPPTAIPTATPTPRATFSTPTLTARPPTSTVLPVPATVTRTATQTARPIPSLTPTKTATPCIGEVWVRDSRGTGWRPGYIVCPTPTRGR